MRYAVVIKKTKGNYSAYMPDFGRGSAEGQRRRQFLGPRVG